MNLKRHSVGEMLRIARGRKGLSGRAIGRLSGKPSSYIQKLESGAITPTVATLEYLCPFYGLEPWEAVAGMTRAELLASLPVPATSPTEQMVRELVARYGQEMVLALLDLAGKVTSPEEFRVTLQVFKAMRGQS